MKKLYSSTIITMLVMRYFFYVKGLKRKNWINYILFWTSAGVEPFNEMGEGQYSFIRKQCPFRNCFVTDDKGYFEKIEEFDIILFNVLNLNTYNYLPSTRAAYQKYVFVSPKPAVDYPIPARYTDFFNWTWTYRLDSDITFSYVTVKNKAGKVIGPKLDMHWLHPDRMKQPNEFVRSKLQNKKTAIAWIKTDCYTGYHEDDFPLQLKKELSLYELNMDIYGQCGDTILDCSINVDSGDEGCAAKLQTDYYFYLALEDAVSEDYVTNKILLSLNNYAVPVVYGGANYSRFMPDGTYLNAYVLGVAEVVKQMNYTIQNKKKYYDFFKWHHHYTFHSPDENAYTDNYCTFCTIVNDIIRRSQQNIYTDLTYWWNSSKGEQSRKPIYVPVVEVPKNIH